MPVIIKTSINKRLEEINLNSPTDLGKENRITKKIKACSELTIGSYMCGFDDALKKLTAEADTCGFEVDYEKTTYLDIAELVYDLYLSAESKPSAVVIMQALSAPVICKNFNFERNRMFSEHSERNFDERIISAIHHTPRMQPLFTVNVKNYLVGIQMYSNNKDYEEYYRTKYKPVVDGKSLTVAQWVGFANQSVNCGDSDFESEAKNDLFYMLIKPFIEYNKILTKGND